MNILMINYEYPPLGGGAGRQCQLLAENLSKKHKVIVVTSHYNGLKTIEKPNKNLIIYRIKVGRKYLYKVRPIELGIFTIIGALKSFNIVGLNNDIDVVISFFAVPSGIIALLLKKLLKIPYIVSLRGFDVPGHLESEYGVYQKITKELIRKVLKSADRVVAVSKYLADIALKLFPDVNIEIISNAVEKITPKTSALNREKVEILSIGRLTKQKKFIDLIKAISLIKSKIEFYLTIIGDGPERESLEKETAKLSLNKKIKFTGWINRIEIEKYYKKADIVVLPSVEEAMSNVLLEAISFGLPVVAINIPSSAEIIKDNKNGFLVTGEDYHKIAEKISVLINSSALRKKFGLNSLKIAKKFSLTQMVNKYENIIINIQNNKTPYFEFGKNWSSFINNYLDKDKIQKAKKSITKVFGSIKGKSFIDVGSGSGLFSLAAYKLGASKIVSFDIDPLSVECCQLLSSKEKIPINWKVKKGSVLDKKFLNNLGKFDIVYSFGVLHHTGGLYEAIKNTASLVKEGGLLYLAIYNKAENFSIFPLASFGSSKFWEKEKKLFVKTPKLFQKIITVLVSFIAPKNEKDRGMAWQTDIVDWLGGYPYECASPEEVFTFVKSLGFSLESLKTNSGLQNNEYLFKKNP